MSAMWHPWIAVALLSVAAAPLSSAEGEAAPPAPAAAAPAHPHSEEAKPQDEASRAEPEQNPRTGQRTLDRGASEQAWRNWLQSPESRDPAAPPRRITPKSVFITPHNCPDGKRLSGDGCITVVTVGKDVHKEYILEQLNSRVDGGGVVYDYDDQPPAPSVDAAEGPLQLNLPLGLPLVAAASQNLPSRLPLNKKSGNKKTESQEAELEAELEKLRLELHRLNNIGDLRNPQTHVVLDDYRTTTADKPKRDNSRLNDTAPESDQDQGQKEIVFGNVSEDPFMLANRTIINYVQESADNKKIHSSANDTNAVHAPEVHNITKQDDGGAAAEHPPAAADNSASQTGETKTTQTTEVPEVITTTQSTHNLKENEKPTRLHPEIDYSDIGEAVKIISRYAEVTTDDSFKGEQKKQWEEEEGPLGTRTKLQHRRRQRPTEREAAPAHAPPSQPDPYARLYPPPPPPPPASVYADRIASYIAYPKPSSFGQSAPPEYYRYPAPPPGYPFRHVQEYWARPEQYLGPYAHGNPRRHHHSYSQPPRRARRPAPAPAAPRDRDLYTLLALRHWLSGDGAAER